MTDNKMKPGKVLIEVIDGPEGACISIGDESSGYRLAGPKPRGGGRVIHRFEVDAKELVRESKQLCPEENP